ncbi:MAG: HEPN domain-containing protein [Candidatus Hydrogenedentota bacterium]
MNIKQKIDYWTNLAIDNCATAKILLDNDKHLDAGFYCHQAIEKFFKAYYWYINKSKPPYIHNLIKLAEKSNLYKQITDEQIKLFDLLMPLNIEVRYPDSKEEILKSLSKERSKEIYSQNEVFCKWIVQLLNQ